MRAVPVHRAPPLPPIEAVEWASPRFRAALERARRFAPVRAPLLLHGETGAGKTAFAELAHRHGPEPDAPFFAVNCASLPATLLESELFGHVRGAFTGAETDRDGLLRAAGRGTVFLDEIDKAPRALQAALLHVLDRREVRPVGGTVVLPLRARLVFATNHEPLPDADVLLPDLWYRIGALRVEVPPLRRRREDLPRITELAAARLEREGCGPVRVTRAARTRLAAAPWPGNVRELIGRLRAAALLGDPPGRIDEAALRAAAPQPHRPSRPGSGDAGEDLAARVRAFEIDEILLAMRVEGGHQGRAAQRLGLTRRGLNKKLHRFDLIRGLEEEGLIARPAAGPPGERERNETLW